MHPLPAPAPLPAESLPTVAEVLQLPEIVAGAPEVVTGANGLARAIRWAHVVAGQEAISLLDGGELVLTTGEGWQHASDEALLPLFSKLVTQAPAAIIFELGTRFITLPAQLRKICHEKQLPLIALHRTVRFAQVTQQVHQRILAAQNAALSARAAVHTMLTELGLNRSPIDYIVERIATTLGAPVVLEDTGHHVVAWSGTDSAVLESWASAAHHPQRLSAALPAQALRIPVEAQGQRWGYLTALPGPAHPAGRETVLELGAFALALARLADPEAEQWLETGAKQLLSGLLAGRYSGESELLTQLQAAGLPITGRALYSATLSGVGNFGAHNSLETAILSTALRRALPPEGRVILTPQPAAGAQRTLLALISLPLHDAQLSASTNPASHPLTLRLNRELLTMLPDTTPPEWRAHLSLGPALTKPRDLITSLQHLSTAGPLPAARPSRTGKSRVFTQLAAQRPLAFLVRGLSGNPQLQEFANKLLAPVLDYHGERGPGHPEDLLRVLKAYLHHPTNRSVAAAQANLSRSVFYQRLGLLEELLGVDLSAGEAIAQCTVALLIHEES